MQKIDPLFLPFRAKPMGHMVWSIYFYLYCVLLAYVQQNRYVQHKIGRNSRNKVYIQNTTFNLKFLVVSSRIELLSNVQETSILSVELRDHFFAFFKNLLFYPLNADDKCQHLDRPKPHQDYETLQKSTKISLLLD